jgi:hypothetical protein
MVFLKKCANFLLHDLDIGILLVFEVPGAVVVLTVMLVLLDQTEMLMVELQFLLVPDLVPDLVDFGIGGGYVRAVCFSQQIQFLLLLHAGTVALLEGI